MDYSIRIPARLDNGGSTFDMLVDIDNDKIELVSEDEQNRISLDVLCVASFEDVLHNLVNSKQFQAASAKKMLELRRRHDPDNISTS